MQLLKNTIVDIAPPQPYPATLSTYKQTRLKSSKDLVSHHINRDKFAPIQPSPSQPKSVADSLYVTTTRSPMKESPQKVNNPESNVTSNRKKLQP